jgi:site-specific recombinase XerD
MEHSALPRDRPGVGSDEPLFITLQKRRPYGTQDLRKLAHAVTSRAGIQKRVWPQLFRHSLAANMLLRGAHILAIKEQLGHGFVETTGFCLRAASIAMQAQYRFFAPSYL